LTVTACLLVLKEVHRSLLCHSSPVEHEMNIRNSVALIVALLSFISSTHSSLPCSPLTGSLLLAPYTISSQADVDALSSVNCTQVYSDIVVATDATNISFSGIQTIWGSLDVSSSPALGRLSAPSLSFVGGNFSLQSLENLSSIEFPKLQHVQGLSWHQLPRLNEVDFTQSLEGAYAYEFTSQEVTSLLILNISNTSLTSLGGFSPNASMGSITIVDNPNLNLLNLSNFVQIHGPNIGSTYNPTVTISNNGPSLSIDFSQLQVTYDFTIEDCSSLNIQSLATTAHFLLQNNSMGTLNCPSLQSVASFTVDSPGLIDIYIPNLNSVIGDMIFDGNISDFSLSNRLDISGGLNINTTYSGFNCTPFEVPDTILIGGSLTCRASEPGSTQDTAIHYHPPHGGLSTGAKAGIAVGSIVGGILLIGALFIIGRNVISARKQTRLIRESTAKSSHNDGIEL